MRQFPASLRASGLSKLLQDTTFVFISNFGSAITLFVSSVILARFWGVAAFGSITSLFGIASLAVGLTDLGINLSAIRLFSQYHQNDPARYHFLLALILFVEVALGMLITLVAVFGAPFIAAQILQAPAESGAVRWMLLGAAFLSASAYATVILQMHRRFPLYALLSILGTSLRTIGTVAASFFWQSIEAVALAYCAATLLTMMVGFAIVVPRFPPLPGLEFPFRRQTTRVILEFAKWVAVTATLNTLLMRTDIVLLSALGNSVQVALYGVAFQLAIGANIAIHSFNTILLPRASSIHTRRELESYAKQAVLLSAIVGGGTGVVFVFAETLVAILYGNAFLAAVPILRLLLVAYFIYAFTYPFVLLTYRLDRPDIPSKVNATNLVLLFIGDWFLIPRVGALGPAVMFLILIIMGQGIILLWLATRGRYRARQLGLLVS